MLSKRQILIVAGIVAVILLIGMAIYFGRMAKTSSVSLTAWVVFDDPNTYEDIVSAFRKDTNIRVTFAKKEIDTYEGELVNALAAGTGPDILVINNAWLPKHKDKLAPAPITVITPSALGDAYPQVVADDFVSQGRVWAIPLSVDTLALFYNRDLFDQAGIAFPPKTWEELLADVPLLTKADGFGELQQSAIAMGTYQNINRPSDILSTLMLQTGNPIVDRSRLRAVFGEESAGTSPGTEALLFYLQFADPSKGASYTWSDSQHYSVDAFSEGTLAMMLSYAYQMPLVRSKGPFVNFSAASLPQPAEAASRVDYANYWGYGVAKRSRYQTQAWQFVTYLTSAPQARSYMTKTAKPPARRDLIQATLDQPVIGVFGRQALTAKSWFQPDSQSVEQIFQGMVESVRRGEVTADEAVRKAVSQINLLLAKFQNQ